MKTALLTTLGLTLISSAAPLAQAQWLERLDQGLSLESSDGFLRADFSGLLDLEAYYIDQRPPGLLFGNDSFLNPRLSLFLEGRAGNHWYAFAQIRADRGFDPRARHRDLRADEYFLRFTPLEDSRLNFQFGKFATVAGNWVNRHLSWDNPFINAPLPYENVVGISDNAAPPTPAALLARRLMPDNKAGWVPVLWGPAYTAGGAVFGSFDKIDYAFEIKNAAISSRPTAWSPFDVGWDDPTLTARLGYRPDPAWNFGWSASGGSYLLSAAQASLPPGKRIGDYRQLTLGHDAAYSWRHLQLWAEIFASRFEVPNVGNADTLAYYIEARYKFAPRWFGAIRWNQQFFGRIADGTGGRQEWDNAMWRVDTALGYRHNRHLQGKLQYSYNRQRGNLQQGEQLVAAQVTLKF